MRLLEGAVADPARAIGKLDILGADERHTILREWNATARAVAGATLPELFAAQVARTPDADAVVFEDERLSYGELDARSSRLAHQRQGTTAPYHRRGRLSGRRRRFCRDQDAGHPGSAVSGRGVGAGVRSCFIARRHAK